jgi:sulfur carrier protein ThiS adenylyltransferase
VISPDEPGNPLEGWRESMSSESLFKRNVPGILPRLQQSVVGIAGCGGLGSNAAVALVRAGVGRLILVDHDVVDESNLNRQYYFQPDVGRIKVEALAGHLRAINPRVNLEIHNRELTRDDVGRVFGEAQLLIEAFDRAESKKWLLETWAQVHPDRPLVCASGISGLGRLDQLHVRHAGHCHLVGDESSDMSEGLCAARVAVVANMQASLAIDLLLEGQ